MNILYSISLVLINLFFLYLFLCLLMGYREKVIHKTRFWYSFSSYFKYLIYIIIDMVIYTYREYKKGNKSD